MPPSNRWSHRRGNWRRPAVCHTPPEDRGDNVECNAAAAFGATWDSGLTEDESFVFGPNPVTRVPGFNLWTHAGLGSAGTPYTLTFTYSPMAFTVTIVFTAPFGTTSATANISHASCNQSTGDQTIDPPPGGGVHIGTWAFNFTPPAGGV